MSEQDAQVMKLVADLLANPATTIFADPARGPSVALLADGAIHSVAYLEYAKTNWAPEGV